MIVYTVIIDDYDRLMNPRNIRDKNVKYVCFTNTDIKRSGWEMVKVDKFTDAVRTARYYKINIHELFDEDEIVVFLDGRFTILNDFMHEVAGWLGNKDIALRNHPRRTCIYDEANYLIKSGRFNNSVNIINKQMNEYRNDGYPENNGLSMTNFIVRCNTKNLREFNELWWKMIKDYSNRDQLSFNYVSWKLKKDYNVIPHNLKHYIQRRFHQKP